MPKPTKPNKDRLNTRETAELLGVSPSTVERLAAIGTLRKIKRLFGKTRVVYDTDEVIKLLEANQV